MAVTKNAKTFVLLDESNDCQVIVRPKNEDNFCVEVEEAVRACQLVSDSYSFVSQVKDLQEFLAKWIEDNRRLIHAAYLTIRTDGILFLVVQTKVERDDELSDTLTDLDISIASKEEFNLINVEVLSTPLASREAIDAFMSSGRVIRYANKSGA